MRHHHKERRKGRVLGKPLAKTYLAIPKPGQAEPVHIRLYAPDYGVDRRGTGNTVAEAIANARSKVTPKDDVMTIAKKMFSNRK